MHREFRPQDMHQQPLIARGGFFGTDCGCLRCAFSGWRRPSRDPGPNKLLSHNDNRRPGHSRESTLSHRHPFFSMPLSFDANPLRNRGKNRSVGTRALSGHYLWLAALSCVLTMEAFLIGEIRLTGTRVAFSQTCSTGVHPPGKDRENLNQRGPESWGWSGMIAEMFNPGKACSIGLSRRAPWRTGEPGWLAMD